MSEVEKTADVVEGSEEITKKKGRKKKEEETVEAPAAVELVEVTTNASKIWAKELSFIPQLPHDLTERKEAIRNCIKTGAKAEDKLRLITGELLYEVSANSYWKEWKFTDDLGESRNYGSFEEYVQNEVGIQRRTAYNLINVYKKYVLELDLPADCLTKLEFSKAHELIPVVTRDNVKDLIDKTSDLSFRKVKDLVAHMKGKVLPASSEGSIDSEDKSSESTDETVTMRFVFTKDQASIIETALGIAQSMSGSDVKAVNLHFICTEFVATTSSSGKGAYMEKLDSIVKAVQETFKVELEVKSVDLAHVESLEEKA